MMLPRLKTFNIVQLLRLDRLKTPIILSGAIGIFIAANILLAPFAFRLDFSFGQAYTLSQSTKKIIQKLDEGITIKLFASSDLPTRILPVKNEVIDLLNEYKKINTGKITLKILDPKKDQNALKDASELGIPELQFSQMEQDKYAVSSSYFAIATSYKDKKEIMPQVTDVESLEYNLTAMIYKMTRKEAVKIGIMGKDPVYDPQSDDMSLVKQVFGQQFEIEYVNLPTNIQDGTLEQDADLVEIDSSYKAVLVFDGNTKEFTNNEITAIKKYLDENGKIILFVDGVWVSDSLSTSPAKHNLYNTLREYGIELQQNLILSTSGELVNFGNSMVQFLSPYPFWLKTNIFNTKTSYFSNIRQITFPWTSSLKLKNNDNWKSSELISSITKSWEQKESSTSAIILNPQGIIQPNEKDLKTFVLVAESKNKAGGALMVIPSTRFILDRFLSRGSDNLEFVLNAVNDYASGGALSGIRQRAVSFYPLPELSSNEKDMFKYLNILVLPLLFGIVGGYKLFKRK